MRTEGISWEQVSRDLDAEGNASIERVLAADECDEVRALYEEKKLFRKSRKSTFESGKSLTFRF